MRNLLLITLLSLCSCLTAQRLPNPIRNFRSFGAPKLTRTLAQQRALNKVQRYTMLQQKTPVFKLKQSISTIKLPTEDFSLAVHWENPEATAFVFEEIYNGKKYLWGVTATHYFFQNPLLKGPAVKEEQPITFVAQGHAGLNDVSLFLIPPQLQDQFVPLPLAQASAQVGDKLYSAGYFDGEFHIEKDRVVTEKTPHKFMTSLNVEDKLSREGACGSPVLNERGEVVGMHVGSSQRRQLGFVVPVENIYELLKAVHNNGKASRPFYFKGREMGTLNINEHILAIEVWKGRHILDNFLSYRNNLGLDYEHLEMLVNSSEADSVHFVIERTPFSMLEQDQHTYSYEIIYNLKNFSISKRKIK